MDQTVGQIIEAKGGSAAFAKACGLEASAVRMMKYRNKLPRTAWPEIMTAFPDLTLDVLRASEAARPAAQDEAA